MIAEHDYRVPPARRIVSAEWPQSVGMAGHKLTLKPHRGDWKAGTGAAMIRCVLLNLLAKSAATMTDNQMDSGTRAGILPDCCTAAPDHRELRVVTPG